MPLLVQPFAWAFNRFQYYIIRMRIAAGFLAIREQAEKFGHNVSYLPNAVPFPGESYNACVERREYLFTVGAMGYPPNSRGVDKFLKDIWPDFHRKYPDVRYVIAGKGAPESCIKQWNDTDGVEYVGFVEDLDKLYENGIAAVIPIWEGSGSAIKTREALIHSRCCFSSSFGARGLESSSELVGEGLFMFESPKEFVAAFDKIVDDSSRSLYEGNVFQYAAKNFSLASFEEKVEEMLRKKNLLFLCNS